MIPEKGFKTTTYATGFEIEDSSSKDEDTYVIMTASNCWDQEYLLKLK